MWRQGDIFIENAKQIPAEARRLTHLVLAEGEITGHAHRVTGGRGSAVLFDAGASLFLDVCSESVDVAHEEHGTIQLPRGTYRVWRQREYSPKEIRMVRD